MNLARQIRDELARGVRDEPARRRGGRRQPARESTPRSFAPPPRGRTFATQSTRPKSAVSQTFNHTSSHTRPATAFRHQAAAPVSPQSRALAVPAQQKKPVPVASTHLSHAVQLPQVSASAQKAVPPQGPPAARPQSTKPHAQGSLPRLQGASSSKPENVPFRAKETPTRMKFVDGVEKTSKEAHATPTEPLKASIQGPNQTNTPASIGTDNGFFPSNTNGKQKIEPVQSSYLSQAVEMEGIEIDYPSKAVAYNQFQDMSTTSGGLEASRWASAATSQVRKSSHDMQDVSPLGTVFRRTCSTYCVAQAFEKRWVPTHIKHPTPAPAHLLDRIAEGQRLSPYAAGFHPQKPKSESVSATTEKAMSKGLSASRWA